MLEVIEPAIAEVFITDELARRAPKKTDYLQEKRALQELVARMAERPEEILPKFVDLAIEMADGVSAGLSLYESNPAPGVFRWKYLRGSLARFDGATTPRNFSPCGITLDQNAPVLSTHPERVYDWISAAEIVVPEVLLVPLYIDGERPLGTLWIVSDREGHFDSGHARVMTELASFVGIALRIHRTEQRLHQALDEQATLAKEMSHRLKNLFAIAVGMVHMTARATTSKEEMAEVLSGRLHALANAHALIRRNLSEVGAAPRASDLASLIGAVVRPHDGGGRAASRFSITGPKVECGDHAMNGVALVFHELATNATKYGALRADNGHVDISWRLAEGKLYLSWVERGGPPIEQPSSPDGFGSKLAQTTIVRQFRGTLEYDWQRAGLVVSIAVPVENLLN